MGLELRDKEKSKNRPFPSMPFILIFVFLVFQMSLYLCNNESPSFSYKI